MTLMQCIIPPTDPFFFENIEWKITQLNNSVNAFFIRAIPFKSVGGGGGRRNGRFFEGGEGPNSELVYTIRVYMISGRRGRGVSNF